MTRFSSNEVLVLLLNGARRALGALVLGWALAAAATSHDFEEGRRAFEARDHSRAQAAFARAEGRDTATDARVQLYRGLIALREGRHAEAAERLFDAMRGELPAQDQLEANIGLAFLHTNAPDALERASAVAGLSGHERSGWILNAAAGVEHVTGLALDRVRDAGTLNPERASDLRLRGSAGIRYAFPVSKATSLGASLEASLQSHRHHHAFDLWQHRLGARWAYRTDPNGQIDAELTWTRALIGASRDNYSTEKGLRLGYARARLAGVESLTLHADLSGASTDYEGVSAPDGGRTQLGLQFAYGVRSMPGLQWQLGLDLIRAGAQSDVFAYRGHALAPGITYAIDARSTVSAGLSFGEYRYRGLDTVQTDRRRSDSIAGLRLAYTRVLAPRWALQVYGSVIDQGSNLARQDFRSNVLGVSVQGEF